MIIRVAAASTMEGGIFPYPLRPLTADRRLSPDPEAMTKCITQFQKWKKVDTDTATKFCDCTAVSEKNGDTPMDTVVRCTEQTGLEAKGANTGDLEKVSENTDMFKKWIVENRDSVKQHCLLQVQEWGNPKCADTFCECTIEATKDGKTPMESVLRCTKKAHIDITETTTTVGGLTGPAVIPAPGAATGVAVTSSNTEDCKKQCMNIMTNGGATPTQAKTYCDCIAGMKEAGKTLDEAAAKCGPDGDAGALIGGGGSTGSALEPKFQEKAIKVCIDKLMEMDPARTDAKTMCECTVKGQLNGLHPDQAAKQCESTTPAATAGGAAAKHKEHVEECIKELDASLKVDPAQGRLYCECLETQLEGGQNPETAAEHCYVKHSDIFLPPTNQPWLYLVAGGFGVCSIIALIVFVVLRQAIKLISGKHRRDRKAPAAYFEESNSLD